MVHCLNLAFPKTKQASQLLLLHGSLHKSLFEKGIYVVNVPNVESR